jgi:signal transduction histidine kinase
MEEAHLQRVLFHLVSNALLYRKPGIPPMIRISAKSLAEGWLLSVRDNGSGIAPEDLGRIFKPLQRLHSTDHSGVGLGLAVSKRIVELYGGEIWAESVLGEGCTFCFTVFSNRQPS